MSQETKNDVLEAAIKFMMELISLWNEQHSDDPITKEDLKSALDGQ